MKEVSLIDVCAIKNGYAFKSSEFKDSGTPLIRISSFNNGPVYFDDRTVYVENEYLESKSTFKVEKGDVLIALSGATTGKYGLYTHDKPSLLNQRVGLLKSGVSQDLDDKYFYFYLSVLQKEIFRKAGGAAQPNISTKEISEFTIPLPPLDQQKKIASVLDAADAYRQKTKALIEKYDELLNSIVYQCLGDSLNKDLKNIKSGSNEFLEDGYSWYSLNEITEVIADIDHKMPKSVEKGKIFLSAKDLSDNGELDFSNPKFISEEDFKHLSRKVKPKKLDVIYSRIGAKLGKARLVKTDHDFIVSYSCCTIRPKQDIVAPLYLKYILDSKATLRQASHGTRGIGVPDLGMGEIRTFKIPVPEKSISKKIVNQLEIIEAQKAQAQDSLAGAEDLFNSLLQRAFKGELK